MHYVKHFTINGVDTKQVACIELKGKPNAATEGSVGLLAIDISSPMHDVYKCIGVEGNIYHWELLSSGTCIMSSTITGAGEELAEFPYDKLRTVANYVVKVGDVIIDKEGFLYQVESVGYDYCIARYNGTQIVSGMPKVGQVDNGKLLSVVDGCHTFVDVENSSVAGYVDPKFDKGNRDIETNAGNIAKNTEDISKNTEDIAKNTEDIEDIVDGSKSVGVANQMKYTLIAKGSWGAVSGPNVVLSEKYIISKTNFIKPNTRYLIKADGSWMDGFSNSTGSEIRFHHIATNYVDGDDDSGLSFIIHDGKILYKTGTSSVNGLYFVGLKGTISDGKASVGSLYNYAVLTHIYEGETLPT